MPMAERLEVAVAVAIVFETHSLTTDNEAGLATVWSRSWSARAADQPAVPRRGELRAGDGPGRRLPTPFRRVGSVASSDRGMTAGQAEQVRQARGLLLWVGLAGLEPATER
jgi:hypothetical protein